VFYPETGLNKKTPDMHKELEGFKELQLLEQLLIAWEVLPEPPDTQAEINGYLIDL